MKYAYAAIGAFVGLVITLMFWVDNASSDPGDQVAIIFACQNDKVVQRLAAHSAVSGGRVSPALQANLDANCTRAPMRVRVTVADQTSMGLDYEGDEMYLISFVTRSGETFWSLVWDHHFVNAPRNS